jgi:Holliday junction DNA helicase RuvA
MLEGVEGKVVEKRETEVVVQVGGFYLRLNCTPGTLNRLVKGETALLLTRMAYSQDRPPELYGFAEREELDLFDTLLKMSKIGPKSAMKILSATTPSRLRSLIATRNTDELSRLPGVEKKTAERIVVELASVLNIAEGEEEMRSLPTTQRSTGEDAIIALASLGFDEQQARRTVAGLLKKNPSIDTQELIKTALKEIRG